VNDRNLLSTQTSPVSFEDEKKPYCLRIVISPEPGIAGRDISPDTGTFIIGRASDERLGSLIRRNRVMLPDLRISQNHARLSYNVTSNSFTIEDFESKNGTWINGRKIKKSDVKPQDVIRVGDTVMVFCRLIWPPAARIAEGEGLIGVSMIINDLRKTVRQIAPSNSSVLICGETGTGKELVARAIYANSGRTGELTAINCTSIPEHLFESELFGVKKGAFSGADRDRKGFIVSADNGVLFMDEIGDMPLQVQPKLLRAIEQQELTPLGTTTAVKFNVRFLAATNSDIDLSVEKNLFRPDLLHRLDQFRINIAPLRERKEDIPVLWENFVGKENADANIVEALLIYPWHGNVRELKNTASEYLLRDIEHGKSILSRLPQKIREYYRYVKEDKIHDTPLSSSVKTEDNALPRGQRPSRESLLDSLRRHNGNISAVASEFSRERPQIYRWMKYYGIEMDEVR
jgi:DNA-binding NtrC family response regulator